MGGARITILTVDAIRRIFWCQWGIDEFLGTVYNAGTGRIRIVRPRASQPACEQAPATPDDTELKGVDPLYLELLRQNVDLQRKIRTLPDTDELVQP